MNQHICKAKTLDGEWVYGYYVALPDEYTHGKDIVHAILSLDCEHVCMGEYKDSGWYEVIPETVCRCTGVKDNNGNMIFEHDIVEHSYYGSGSISEITWYYGGFIVGTTCIGYIRSMRIHGNKFDNTELM